jgi:adenylosuccinate synthase
MFEFEDQLQLILNNIKQIQDQHQQGQALQEKIQQTLKNIQETLQNPLLSQELKQTQQQAQEQVQEYLQRADHSQKKLLDLLLKYQQPLQKILLSAVENNQLDLAQRLLTQTNVGVDFEAFG